VKKELKQAKQECAILKHQLDQVKIQAGEMAMVIFHLKQGGGGGGGGDAAAQHPQLHDFSSLDAGECSLFHSTSMKY
jgi:hypothetical protein